MGSLCAAEKGIVIGIHDVESPNPPSMCLSGFVMPPPVMSVACGLRMQPPVFQ